jgi:hypothetical protein
MSSGTDRSAREQHASADIYIAFVPWILFSVISHRDTLAAATVVALIAAIAIAARSIAAGQYARQSVPPELWASPRFAGSTAS